MCAVWWFAPCAEFWEMTGDPFGWGRKSRETLPEGGRCGAGTLSWGPWGVTAAVGRGGLRSALGVGRPLWQYLKDRLG